MNILTTLNLLLELAVQYLRLKIKTSTYDILEKFDSRLDKLDQQREKLRAAKNSVDQERADQILNEILEEQKKKKLFLEDQKLIDGSKESGTLKA